MWCSTTGLPQIKGLLMKSNEMVEVPKECYEELLETERKYLLLKEEHRKFLLVLEEYKKTFLAG